jgi:serine/threonine protein kinase
MYVFISFQKSIFIFMEFCGINCTLERLCKESSGLSEELVRSFTNSLLKAVEVLHDNNIVHRDIKPQNIFLKEVNGSYVLKLGDFGCSFKSSAQPPTDANSSANAASLLKATGIVGTTCKYKNSFVEVINQRHR